MAQTVLDWGCQKVSTSVQRSWGPPDTEAPFIQRTPFQNAPHVESPFAAAFHTRLFVVECTTVTAARSNSTSNLCLIWLLSAPSPYNLHLQATVRHNLASQCRVC